MDKALFSTLGGVLFFLGLVRYGWVIWKNRNNPDVGKPTTVSWLIWISVDFVSLLAMWSRHALNGQIIGTVIGGIVVLALAFKYGERGWSTFEKWILAGAVCGALAWAISGNADVGIVVSGILLLIGAVPTVTSVWKSPAREDKIAWTLYFVSCICALIGVPHWNTLADTVQPLTFAVIETAVVILLYTLRRK